MSELFANIEKTIRNYDKWLIVSHVNPDGDALGSTLAVHEMCKQWGIESVCLNQSPIPEKYTFLPSVQEINHPDELTEQYSHVITVDSADWERIGEKSASCVQQNAVIINIDHHNTNDHYGEYNAIQTKAAATAQIIYEWVESSTTISWNKELATVVYTGILDDTGGFRYSNTTPEIMSYAAQLMEYGALAHQIADQVLETMTIKSLSLLQLALSSLQCSEDGRIAWMYINHRDVMRLQASDADLDGIVNYARNIRGVDVGLMFREMKPDDVKISLRSRVETDVSKVASHFNGGGHIHAAGCSVHGSLSDVIQRVVEQVQIERRRG